jgi:hypothetical protein
MLKSCPLDTDTAPALKACSGTALAYALRSKSSDQRALFAVTEIGAVDWALKNPTDKQLYALLRITRYQLDQARELDPRLHHDVNAGLRRLSNVSERLARTVRKAGVDATWNALVAVL